MHYEIQYSCISHIGKVRTMNQDNFICNSSYLKLDDADHEFSTSGYVTSKMPTLFGIFDGMGGEECGEIASYIAAENASNLTIGRDSVAELTQYCKEANEKICQYAAEHSVSAMGTTVAMLLFSRKEVTLCNIGDSKIFRFSEGELEQISKDHVVISAFGTKPPLSQSLGIPPNELLIEPYLAQGRYKNGDIYLICSDGLTDMITPNEIQGILVNYSIQEATSALVSKALENGGRDNITIILLEVKQMKNKFLKISIKVQGETNYDMSKLRN